MRAILEISGATRERPTFVHFERTAALRGVAWPRTSSWSSWTWSGKPPPSTWGRRWLTRSTPSPDGCLMGGPRGPHGARGHRPVRSDQGEGSQTTRRVHDRARCARRGVPQARTADDRRDRHATDPQSEVFDRHPARRHGLGAVARRSRRQPRLRAHIDPTCRSTRASGCCGWRPRPTRLSRTWPAAVAAGSRGERYQFPYRAGDHEDVGEQPGARRDATGMGGCAAATIGDGVRGRPGGLRARPVEHFQQR